ncbi:AAA family ATPase [Candidatus Nomurabacteria bacterium]|nr:AAA family ATPase [Candidatus Nomurabacteria bacterium]
MSDLFESAADFLLGDMKIEYLVEGIIEKNTTGVLFGESGAGKSFIAVDLGLSVAVGVEIFNNNLAKKGLVLYVAGEGYGGLKRRVKAWLLCNGQKIDDLKDFYLSKEPISFDSEGEGVARVIEEGKRLEMDGTPVSLIIIDTLARHIEGDENSTKDMSNFVEAADKIKNAFPNSVIVIVHHSGLNDKGRSRGSSALKGAMDFEIQTKKGTKKNTGEISFTKMKDSEPPDAMAFTLVPVDIGCDKNGNQMNSCVVEYGGCAAKPIHQKAPSGFEVIALKALINACITEKHIEEGKYYATFEGWRIEFQKLRMLDNPDATDKAISMSFHRSGGNGVSQKLEKKGYVLIAEIGAFPLLEKDQARIASEIIKRNMKHDGTLEEHVP